MYVQASIAGSFAGLMQAWWSELVTNGGAPPGRFAHAAAGAGETMYMVGGYAQGVCFCMSRPSLHICWEKHALTSTVMHHL